jgi:lysophospholipid acyltransferase (LPLAT)-like uncharacterized protein
VTIRSPLFVKVASFLFAMAMKAIFRTLRHEFHTAPNTNPYNDTGGQRFLYAVWHDSVIFSAFGGKHRACVALTSRHRDGSFVTGVVKWIGVPAVRGSTGHGGGNALRALIKTALENHIVISPDGPRGPRRTMSSGMVFLASRTGNAIVPTAFQCHRSWKIPGRWTDLIIPKPFTRIYLLTDGPIFVPPNISRDEIERYTVLAQNAMDALNAKADCLVGGAKAPEARFETSAPTRTLAKRLS